MYELEFTDTATIHLLRKIAAGGMGVVYEGQKIGADGFTKQVAVKMLRGQHSQAELFQDLLIALCQRPRLEFCAAVFVQIGSDKLNHPLPGRLQFR